jgi:hypothetical protein
VRFVASLQECVEAVSLQRLSPIVRLLLDDDQLAVLDREVSPLAEAGNATTRGLFRISGIARLGSGKTTSWRLVLKVVGDTDLFGPGYCHEPTDWNYWKREALAFESGLLDGWAGPLWPIRALAVDEVSAEEAWIWLQSCGDGEVKEKWSLDRLASTAHDLGAVAAQWAATPPDRDQHPWLDHRWVDGWVATARKLGADHAAGHDGCWISGPLREVVSVSAPGRVATLMASAGPLQERLASLPPTLAHHDAQWSNAFSAQEAGLGQGTVLIDWSYLGLAPVGTDLGLSVGWNVLNGAVDSRRAQAHDRSATDAYLRGLREHGWAGSPDAVRFARAASASLAAVTLLAAQASWLCPAEVSSVGDMSTWPEEAAAQRHTDVATVMAEWAAGLDFVLDLGEEAMRLSDRLW